jgi:hypothetical protein
VARAAKHERRGRRWRCSAPARAAFLLRGGRGGPLTRDEIKSTPGVRAAGGASRLQRPAAAYWTPPTPRFSCTAAPLTRDEVKPSNGGRHWLQRRDKDYKKDC